MRSTGNKPDFIRHTYKVLKVLRSYTVFELQKVNGNTNLLSNIIRIEKFRGKSNATNIKHYLRLRNTSNWSKCKLVTGLRPTIKDGLFYGDLRKPGRSNTVKKTLLLFLFLDASQTLYINVYRGFYPNHNGILQDIISTY